ncbi:MAG: diacylglycerol kinase family lipid kinase [Eubacteriales bacterium]|nr:diacylglycerol kinase family lipid kinase [Eubacteriales bacterium]
MTDYLLIHNPVAGNGASIVALNRAKELLDAANTSYEVWESQYPFHSIDLAKKAIEQGYPCIVAVGGDGTVREVAMSLIETDIPLGIIPCGTGNDYVRPLGIPTNVDKAVDILLKGERLRVDTGEINGQRYINVAGFGFDVDVLDSTERYKKKIKNGSLAYLRGLINALKHLKMRKTHIVLPDRELDFDALLFTAGNGTHFGGGMNITPKANPNDGLLDICIAHDVNKLTVLYMLPKLLKGKHLSSKHVTYFNATSLTAVCDPISRIEVDGEVMEGTPIDLRIVPQSLTVLVKKNG